jgi:DNA-binding CsgD family transcriptional regulator
MQPVLDRIEKLMGIRTIAGLAATVHEQALELGLSFGSAVALRSRPGLPRRVVDISCILPDAPWYQDASQTHVDPVMQALARTSLPVIWGRDDYVRSGQIAKWDLQAAVGMECGVAVAMHMPNGRHFAVGFDGRASVLRSGRHLEHVIGVLQMTAVYSEAVFSRLEDTSLDGLEAAVELSDRERECLLWASEGKTSWETGVILGISERTVNKHVESASAKLSCSSRVQAVVKAIRLGLIQP